MKTEATGTTFQEQLYFLKRSIFHPFDGFYEIKFRNKGSLRIATFVLLVYGLLQCVQYQYTGFIFNDNPIQEMNSVTIFLSSIFLPLLFCISNWSITTLFNGKGTLGDIYIMLCYSMVPMIIFQAITIFLSNYAILPEGMLLNVFQYIGCIWSALLVLFGLCTIHEYSFGTTLLTLLATAAAAIICVFLIMLYLDVMQKLINFVVLLFKNISTRM